MKKLGYLSSASDDQVFQPQKDAFIAGLQQAGYTPGQNVDVTWKFANGDFSQLSPLAIQLVQSQVDVIATVGGAISGVAAVTATSAIPVIYISGYDPNKVGLNKPNATGVNLSTTESEPQRLQHLKELAGNQKFAVLLREGGKIYDWEKALAEQAGLIVVSVPDAAPTASQIKTAFDQAKNQGAEGMIVCADPSLTNQYKEIVKLEKQFNWPCGYSWRQYPEDGGLMSFGPILSQAFTTVGIYAGRLLTGGNPGGSGTKIVTYDPKTDYVLVVNKARADRLGLTIPAPWSGDVVIV